MFSMALGLKGTSFPPAETLDQPTEVEDARDVFSLACATLADRELAELRVEGFGQARWPVDVHTDLSVVMEQLPALFDALGSGDIGVLDFYEQGIERELKFYVQGDHVDIICASRTKWAPNPAIESMGLGELLGMLQSLLSTFIDAIGRLYPALAAHPLLEPWRRALAHP